MSRDYSLLESNQEYANRTVEQADNGYTRADFRAKRESLGLSQYDTAAALSVDQRSVNRWERGRNGRDRVPPVAAWKWLDSYEAILRPLAGRMVRQALAEQGSEDEIVLRYYHSPKEYDDCGREEGNYPFGFVNTATRLAASELREMGRAVALRFCTEDETEYLLDETEEKTGWGELDGHTHIPWPEPVK